MAHRRNYSEKTAEEIDAEVKRFVTEAADEAKNILRENLDVMHRMVEALLEFEVLDDGQLDRLINGEKLERPVIDENGVATNGKPAETPEKPSETEDSNEKDENEDEDPETN